MNKAQTFFILIILLAFLWACDGANYDELSDNHCYFVSNIIGSNVVDPNAECVLTYLFIDEDGNQYEWDFELGGSAVMALPKNKCYEAWLLDTGNGTWGEFTFGVDVNGREGCLIFTEWVDDRLYIVDIHNPEYRFCLDEECNCPD